MKRSLAFKHARTISGSGFEARIETEGRLFLSEVESDSGSLLEIHGVNPGWNYESADTENEAVAAFHETWSKVLEDCAFDAEDFAEFKARVEKIFYDTDNEYAVLWEKACVAALQAREPECSITIEEVS